MPIIEPRTERGFSLVELIVVMVVLGILAGFTALFITKPVVAYLAAQRRAELVDIADTALLRIARDVRLALPNSVRVVSAGGTVGSCNGNEACYLEYLPVAGGGRYRAAQDSTQSCATYPDDNATTGCNILDFRALATGNDASFDMLGPVPAVAANQYLVVYNTGNTGTLFDAWSGGNRREITGSAASTLAFTATGQPLPGGSEAHRFFVTERPVSYVCDPAAHTIRRYWGYDPLNNQPVDLSAAPGQALLANRVRACSFSYNPGTAQRLGQLTLSIQLENAEGDNAEQITLYREVAVNNEP